MTSMELIDALEDIDEAFIADGAPAKKRAAFPVVARRWIAVAACLLLSAGIGFGAWRLQETAPIPENSEEESTVTTTTASTTATTQKPTESTTPPTTGTTNWNGQGGGNFYLTNVYVGYQKHHGLLNYFYEYVRDNYETDKIDEIRTKIAASCNAESYSYTGSSLHLWVRELEISKEKFVELNEQSKEFFKDSEWDLEEYTFTDEEVNDIYTLSIKEFNQKYKSPTAALVGEVLFPFSWFVDNPVETWQQYDFTVEQIQDVLDNGKIANFPEQYIHTFEEKLEDYIDAVTE